ncbi:MAG TPA: glucose-1-phosphate adenylyltransferase, partial [Thermodesulfobacteriota bacterium]|nr:glucose-1-phosphate adenylyltransferase [Thermodesulfobacteriota bacterium]
NYWRDVGNITAFYATHQELLQEHPPFNLHEEEWPVRTFQEQAPPAKIINSKASAEGKKGNKEGMINNALLCNGCVITDGYVHDSILSPFVRVEPSAVVDHSILMKGVSVGEHARLRKTVVDEGIVIPAHYSIGYDADEDRRRFTVSETGVVVVPQGCILD